MSAAYNHVPNNEEDDGNAPVDVELTRISETTTTEESSDYEYQPEVEVPNKRSHWQDPVLISTYLTLFLTIPVLSLSMVFAYQFTDRLWGMWPVVLHLHLRLGISKWQFNNASDHLTHQNRSYRLACSFATALDIGLFGIVYPTVVVILTYVFYRDADGTIVLDWRREVFLLRVLAGIGVIIAILRLGMGLCPCCIRILQRKFYYQNWLPTFFAQSNNSNGSISDTTRHHISKTLRFANVGVAVLNIICVFSVFSHFGPWPEMSVIPEECDPLDTTLCALPFPSFHHLEEDATTNTGWRVHLRGLPPLRGGMTLHPSFLNDLDGFSTMAPILFYMEGLKEAHEGSNNMVNKLQGPESIGSSVTNQSITLLINVDDNVLVAHSAEIDYLDPDRPLVMVIPAQPLQHSTHYAVAVVNATDVNGKRLPQSKGLEALLGQKGSMQYSRYMDVVLPSLQHAAPWIDYGNDPESVQLLFDFVTISEDSQLGHTRATRDAVIEHVGNWDWEDHVEVVSELKHDCGPDSLIARTFHINLDVPSFLKRRSRYSALDIAALDSGKPVSIEKAKAMIRIPCSVEQGNQVNAIMEYGHGLFYHRGEVTDGFLSRMANDNGYILMAMDWRGMSVFDLPVVIKTLIGNPNLFQSVRDNLIQGFAEKLALQHFAHNGMLDWLKVNGVNILTDRYPASVFYGISQGGILGGGYLALSGKTKLIDRGVVGSPGTPFTSVLTRSLDFAGYDILMLFNFYNNRHVRLLLSLIQMGWDSVEVSGLLAPYLQQTESLPPVLIQTGLGDAIVPTGACEAMTRAMHGSTLPNNPRANIYGIPTEEAASQSNVVLTELLYEKEYDSLPIDNTNPEPNSVHNCVRWDSSMINQIEEFANTGNIIDPCEKDQCRRPTSC
eukprot:CAMPEP_0183711454 /NCGR_PEP_ID=MMETSP0737-20130205/6956_1 /TAXON_ID=385413 /ORGANISM="Thalassiosira miniscula, Strain CCMP1093" /LENGTH=892 /DNA_ID=CAMNT_0025939965 /DNA_START=139 /DNA_END=2817 /DNA_ORIENTATION=+